MFDLKTVGLFIDHKLHQEVSQFLQDWFASHQIETTLLSWDIYPCKNLDLIITIGGDGTVLHVLGQFPVCPVLAFNFGTIGFLTAGNREEMVTILEKILNKQCFISERSTLECHYGSNCFHAINEMVIKGINRLVSVDCFVNEAHVRHIWGDGVIVGTPTGSTAYLLSAGAPIVMPEIRCLILAGLNEHNFTSRHLVLNHDANIRLVITPQTKEQEIYLSVDGKNKIPLAIHNELLISEAKQRVQLVFPEKHYFFRNLSSRLSWE